MKKFLIVIFLGLAFIFVGLGGFIIGRLTTNDYIGPPTLDGGRTICETDVKFCPDGSSVGRSGSECEFDPCPIQQYSDSPYVDTSTWQLYTNDSQTVTLKYPPNSEILDQQNGLENMDRLGYIPLCWSDRSIVCISLPSKIFYPMTNFDGAAVSFEVIPNVSSEQSCLETNQSTIGTTPVAGQLAGYKITKVRTGGVAAGNQNQSFVYRLYANNRCYGITEGIDMHTYEPQGTGAVFSQEGQKSLFAMMDQVLGTLQFFTVGGAFGSSAVSD